MSVKAVKVSHLTLRPRGAALAWLGFGLLALAAQPADAQTAPAPGAQSAGAQAASAPNAPAAPIT
jgi:hypothetical protein